MTPKFLTKKIPARSLLVENFAGIIAVFGPFFSTKLPYVENFAGILALFGPFFSIKSPYVENFAGILALFGPFFSTKSPYVENFAGIFSVRSGFRKKAALCLHFPRPCLI